MAQDGAASGVIGLAMLFVLGCGGTVEGARSREGGPEGTGGTAVGGGASEGGSRGGSGGTRPTTGPGSAAIECFGDGSLSCTDGVVKRSRFDQVSDFSQCATTVLVCKDGCRTETAPATADPLSLCGEWRSMEIDAGPSCPADPYHGFEDEPLAPSQLPASAFSSCYGVDRPFAPSSWGTPRLACPGMTDRCTYAPSALPCGACTNEPFCYAGVWAACDHGEGPFLDRYSDQWFCKCESGNWDCRIAAASGSSCFHIPDQDAAAP